MCRAFRGQGGKRRAGALDAVPERQGNALLWDLEQIPAEGAWQKPTPFKKPLSRLTENWMPDKSTPAKSFFTKGLTLSNSLCFE